MCRLFSLAVVMLLTAGGCTQTDDAAAEETTTTIDVTTTTTQTTTTTVAPSTTQAVTTSSVPDIEVSECPSPDATTSGDSERFVDLHRAVEAVVVHTNLLGEALLDVEDFDPGWENQEPVASIIESLLVDLDTVETVTAEVLVDEYGASYDEEAVSWVFPASMTPLSPPFGYLEELAMSPDVYRGDILPLLYSMRTLDEAVQHWNYGASPCGHANGMVERLKGAHSLFSS